MSDFAVIGTRDPSTEQKQWIEWALEQQRPDDILHTGACQGVDQIAADAWLQLGRKVYLHLPWMRYENTWVSHVRHEHKGQGWIKVDGYRSKADTDKGKEARRLASIHHPKWSSLNDAVRALHTRNVGIIRPSMTVYAAPGSKPWGGGTAMGIKIALHLKKTLVVCDPLERQWTTCSCSESKLESPIGGL